MPIPDYTWSICDISQILPRPMPQLPANDKIARAVRTERRRQGLDQEALALVADVGVRTLHRIEHGEPTVRLDRVIAVLDALGLELDLRPRER